MRSIGSTDTVDYSVINKSYYPCHKQKGTPQGAPFLFVHNWKDLNERHAERERVRSRARPVDDEASVTKRSARIVTSYIYVAKSQSAKHKRAKPFKSDLSFVLSSVDI